MSSTETPGPLPIGAILDRSFSISVKLIDRSLLSTILILTVLWAAFDTFLVINGIFVPYVIDNAVFSYLAALTITPAFKLWHGRRPDFETPLETTTQIFGRIFLAATIAGLLSMLYAILLIIPGVVYYTNRVLAPYAIAIEGLGVRDALRRSKSLTTNYRRKAWYSYGAPLWRAMGIGLVVVMVILAPVIVLEAALSFLAAGQEELQGLALFAENCLAYFVVLLGQVLSVVAFLGFYSDLRTRSEALDLRAELQSISA